VTELLASEYLRAELKQRDALWEHNGDPVAPHAILTSGMHSDGYVNMSQAFSYPKTTTFLCEQMIERWSLHCQAHGGILTPPAWVLGSAYAGIAPATEIARQLTDLFGTEVRAGFTEKTGDNDQVLKRFKIKPGETILHVEDLNSTEGTIIKHRSAVMKATNNQATYLNVVLLGVNRSENTQLEDGTPLISLVDLKINQWPADNCPLCQGGSQAFKPKHNWDKLVR